jgi:putative transposase
MRYRRSQIEGATYFFTVVTHQRRELFAEPATVTLLQRAIADVRARRPFVIEAEVVLPNHIHALWTLPEADNDYPTRWRLIKEAFTRGYAQSRALPEPNASRRTKGEQAVWQRRYWEHLIRDDEDFGRHVEYIHYNPVRHGLAAAPCLWAHSTFPEWVAKGLYDANWGADVAPDIRPGVGRE